VLKHGFVDELLFVSERISMPEVLCLDAARISSIRERAQRIVICSSLLLHACNIVQCRISSLQLDGVNPDVRYRKDDIMQSLKTNLPYDELYQAISIAVVKFAEGMSHILQICLVHHFCSYFIISHFINLSLLLATAHSYQWKETRGLDH
jgi:hypothetical protein